MPLKEVVSIDSGEIKHEEEGKESDYRRSVWVTLTGV